MHILRLEIAAKESKAQLWLSFLLKTQNLHLLHLIDALHPPSQKASSYHHLSAHHLLPQELLKVVVSVLHNDIAEDVVGTMVLVEAYTHMEEDKTADDIGYVVEPCSEKHNADHVAALMISVDLTRLQLVNSRRKEMKVRDREGLLGF
ncbi:hypothetical protein FF1_010043 [Malus domestica]